MYQRDKGYGLPLIAILGAFMIDIVKNIPSGCGANTREDAPLNQEWEFNGCARLNLKDYT